MIAGFEEEALHVVDRAVVNAEHGEELAVRNLLALLLAGHLKQGWRYSSRHQLFGVKQDETVQTVTEY